ncbi:exosortase 1, putative [Nitrosococcus oceani AFC27]|uniref:Exosortase n=1 Tax=Nitrosococcus oceani C-27 TaxID=314279 RepID=A0A0E2Z0M8_9GAMM|nr:exosortase A [Nitrosococcus oceani]EDZ67872.1 exosortase 1, putative [Nitrosococcus oceani AFC27]KFI19153.1 exosortase [Nitrosococcus oceani C-27]
MQMNPTEQRYLDRQQAHWVLSWPLATVAIAVVLLALFLFYLETAVSMAAIWWRSATFAHGMLIFPVSGYMIWARRWQLQQLQPHPRPLAAFFILLLSGGWLLARIADVLFVEQLLLVAMIPVVVWGLLGKRVVRALAFPLVYLVFAVPFGEFLIPPLQDFTAAFAVKSLQFGGVPVYWEGRYISIPSGDFLVAEACSGLRYLITSVVLGTLYAYLTYSSYGRRAAFIVASVIVPIIANGIRAYGVIMLAYLSNMKLATGVDHVVYGWIFFGVVMSLLFWLGSFWREDKCPGNRASLSRQSGGIVAQQAPRAKKLGVTTIILILVAGAGPASGIWFKGQASKTDCSVSMPKEQPVWSGSSVPTSMWEPDYSQADQIVRRLYSFPDDSAVQLLIIYYQQEHQGAELISSQNRLYDDQIWRWMEDNRRSLSLGDDHLQVHETVIRSPNTLRVIWHWYDIAGQRTASPIKAKFLEAWAHLTKQPSGSTLIAVAADSGKPEQARALLLKFLNEMPAVSTSGAMLACQSVSERT